jgi:hypothetical protein
MVPTHQRPGKVTFVAVAMIVLGGLAVLNKLTEVPGLVSAATTDAPAQPPRLKPGQIPDGAALHHALAKESAAYYPVKFGTLLAGIVVGVGLFLCGLGVLKLKPIARTSALVIIPLALILSLAANGYEASMVPGMQRTMAQMMQPEQGPAAPPEVMELALGITFYAIYGISLLFAIVINLVLFILLMSSSVKAAFDPAAAQPLPDDEPKQERPKRSRYEGYEDDDHRSGSSSQTGITDLS